MIKDIFFIVKMFVLTVIVVLLLQIQIGGITIDDSFHHWVKHSIVIDYIGEAVDGGRLIFHSLYYKVESEVHHLLSKTTQKHERKKARETNFTLKSQNKEDLDEEENLPQAKIQSAKVY